jgi:integrase
MFRWAASQDIVNVDPTAGLKAYDPGTPRDRVLTANEIGALWSWLGAGNLPVNAVDIIKLQLLTGARCGEISGLRTEEIDTSQWNWTLPATRSKNKRPRVTPLVGLARRIVGARLLTSATGPQFTTETGSILTAAHIGHYLWTRHERMPIGQFTTHDLRRTVATLLAEMGVSLDLIAAVIGHNSSSKETRTLVRHYVHTDLVERKAQVLQAWDERLREIVTGRHAGRA